MELQPQESTTPLILQGRIRISKRTPITDASEVNEGMGSPDFTSNESQERRVSSLVEEVCLVSEVLVPHPTLAL